MEQEKLIQAQKIFGVPEQFFDIAQLMVQEVEWELILRMGNQNVPDSRLRELVLKERLAADPYDFIHLCYHRAIIDKVPAEDGGELAWHIGDFYHRYSFYAQYEYYAYGKLPKQTIEALNQWQFGEYLKMYGDDVRQKIQGIETHVHNSDFLTLEEAFRFVEKHPDSIHLYACNCKSQMYFHDRPICVCLGLDAGPNSEFDRGHGEKLTVEQAQAKLREFNRKGLMQNGEDYAICNCDAYCCYPLQMARACGSQGIYPRSHYLIDWHPEECISCGRCVHVCNFNAFEKDADGKVHYIKDLCWGCTICAENCPKKAIHLIPKEN